MMSRTLVSLALCSVVSCAFAQMDWKPIASPGVEANLRNERLERGPGFTLSYDFKGQAGFVLADKPFVQDLPPNFEFSFWIRSTSLQNDFEFKLMDPTGNSVWWVKRAAWNWPREWTRMVIRRSQLVYAWGPDRKLFPKSGSLQFGVAANAGGKGKVEVSGFEYRELPPTAPFSTELTRQPGTLPERIRLKGLQAVGGFKITGLRRGQRVTLQTPDRTRVFRAGPATADTIYVATPELETSEIDLQTEPGGNRNLNLTPLRSNFSTYPYLTWEGIAKDQPRGLYPLHLLGKQSFFTVVGASESVHEGLINEYGMVELRRMGPSLEPFLFADGKRTDWSNVRSESRLVDGALPIPSVVWHSPVRLVTEAIAPEGTHDQLSVQYRLHNTTKTRQKGSLMVALRPLQVNPSWQSLNLNPLIAPIRSIRLRRGTAQLDDGWTIAPVEAIRHVGATRRSEGDLVPFLQTGTTPTHQSLECPDGDISVLWSIPYDLAPGQSRSVTFRATGPGQRLTQKSHAALRKESEDVWRKMLKPERLTLGGSGQVWAETLMANLAYIMVHRDGPAIHPGSRTYQRSWIRDGALTCTALLQFGLNEPVKKFIDWYATGIREDGWVPCVLDSRGPDPLAEHDSHGQFIYLLATYHRFTGDTATVRRHYSTIKRIVDMIEKLRAERSTAQFRDATGIERGFYGIFPESASHEGYMDHHRHSFWDDFFGVKGVRDATYLAEVMDDRAFAEATTTIAEDFEQKFVDSIEFTQRFHKINFIAGCVELGDFDATSTAIGVYPCGGLRYVPRQHFNATFDRYWKFFTDREAGRIQWRDYTPYEVRVLSAMVLMDEPECAHHMMNWFLRDLRPLGWKHWAEVGYLDAEPGRWIGDMPHTWVGSEFIKALRLMLVHERESDGKLVFGAGIKPSWMTGERGLKALDLPTHFGPVNLTGTLRDKTAVFQLSGQLRTQVPIVLRLPWRTGVRSIQVNGQLVSANQQEVAIPRLPARVEVTLDSAAMKP